MTSEPTTSPVGLLVSGGLDSAILLDALLGEGRRVRPFYVRSGLVWEPDELRAVGQFLGAMSSPGLEELVLLDLPLADVYGDHWSVTGRRPPDAFSPDEAVYLPGRNALLVIKAALWCQMHGIDELALGVLDSNPFADASARFFDDLEGVLSCNAGNRLRVVRPFARLSKRQVMERGRHLPLGLTFSCIAPSDGLHCGQCNKCAERSRAFGVAGLEDPTEYAVRFRAEA
jgi:7-cyano-7-deazaguanine synthase